ncbi:MAG: helix-hairpin-helix domain-containing protein, partial [Terrimicrobiaceae bacterium]|nr:helix-hairpin-helix domain-containing protein [Terrimicrobiaceae bacterium]
MNEVLKQAGSGAINTENVAVREGMKFVVDDDSQRRAAMSGEMTAAKKLALGMPLDINRASKEDLILIPGIGDKTAEKIIALRTQLGGFTHLEQLMQIKGIKE